ncbi:ABC transporter permease [Actinorugispora endophytica]|uniref:Peptide/nickel transport system permease protein n=1 Tax=Actinorugispora endophytica TaxID=1605990 RepID=A0A4R6UVH6_9ACTN|nr:ABC transporter permease [Actinorugispora endophytica]TDQ50266.1 peptide/nickel transport system permease protein [Actinorugispora endophytica]
MRAVFWPLAAAVVGIALFGGALAPHDPTSSIAGPWAAPGAASPLGTDSAGRDVLSRVLAGGRGPVLTAALAALCATAAGLWGGLVAGWRGGWPDRLLSGLADLLMGVPFLLVAMVLAVALPGPAAVAAATVCGGAPLTLRVVRDTVRRLRHSGFVEAARGRGERTGAILVREVLPSVAGIAGADLGLRFVAALQTAAAIGMLGLGAQPPAPDWGLMLRENLAGAALNPPSLVAPAAALTVTALVAAVLARRAADERSGRGAVGAW